MIGSPKPSLVCLGMQENPIEQAFRHKAFSLKDKINLRSESFHDTEVIRCNSKDLKNSF